MAGREEEVFRERRARRWRGAVGGGVGGKTRTTHTPASSCRGTGPRACRRTRARGATARRPPASRRPGWPSLALGRGARRERVRERVGGANDRCLSSPPRVQGELLALSAHGRAPPASSGNGRGSLQVARIAGHWCARSGCEKRNKREESWGSCRGVFKKGRGFFFEAFFLHVRVKEKGRASMDCCCDVSMLPLKRKAQAREVAIHGKWLLLAIIKQPRFSAASRRRRRRLFAETVSRALQKEKHLLKTLSSPPPPPPLAAAACPHPRPPPRPPPCPPPPAAAAA